MYLYKIDNDASAALFEKWANENSIEFEQLDEGNYADVCPECGDYEFWHGGHCSHCGYSM